MNYITYKNIDGTITSGFKVKLYDIVTLNTGYWKDNPSWSAVVRS